MTFLTLCYIRYTFTRHITTFTKVRVAHVFGLQTLYFIDFTKIFQLKALKPKNKGHTNFYECCDLTKKVCLPSIYIKYKGSVGMGA